MIKGSELIGLSVIKDSKIETNYYVTGLVFSRKGFKVLALQVKAKDRRHKQVRLIPYKKIQAIKNNSILLLSENDMIHPQQIPEIEDAYKNPIKVLGFHIYDHQEHLVGVIKDTIIQKTTGKIIAFVISEGVYDDLVEGYSLLPIFHPIDLQKDHIVVGDSELKSILPQGGGLKKLLGIE